MWLMVLVRWLFREKLQKGLDAVRGTFVKRRPYLSLNHAGAILLLSGILE